MQTADVKSETKAPLHYEYPFLNGIRHLIELYFDLAKNTV